MLKKTITFHDLDGNEVTQDFWFHLSKAELLEMEISTTGGLKDAMQRLIDKRDGENIIKTYKELILASYGERSLDGLRFMKEDENGRPLYKDFMQTEAYSELFASLVTDDVAAADFFNGVLPEEVKDKMAEAEAAENLPDLKLVKNEN